MNKIAKYIIKIIIGVAILAILFYKVGTGEIIATIKGVSPIFLIMACLILFLNFLLNTANFLTVSRICTKDIGFWRMFKYYFMMLMVGLFFPGLFGQLSIILFLKKEGLKLSEATAIAMIEKIVMFFVVFLCASIGIFIFVDSMGLKPIFAIVSALFLFGAFITFTKTGHKILSIITPKKLFKRLDNLLKILSEYKNHKKIIFWNLFFSITKWCMRAAYFSFLFIALGTHIPFIYILVISSIDTLVASIPISFGGIGLRESAGTFLYTALGYAPALAMGAYTIALIMIYTIGFISLPFIKLDFSKIKEASK